MGNLCFIFSSFKGCVVSWGGFFFFFFFFGTFFFCYIYLDIEKFSLAKVKICNFDGGWVTRI